MRVRHPYSLDDDGPSPDGTVHWGGRRRWSEVDEDGTFYVPDGRAREFVESWPTAEGFDPDELLLSDAADGDAGGGSDEPGAEPADADDADDDGTCAGTKANGEPCGNAAGDDGYCHLHGPED